MLTNETFQQTFAEQITNLVQQAYHCGVLQYHPMMIVDMTISMQLFQNFNQVTVQASGCLMSVSVYDSDSEAVQNDTIANLLADMIAKIR